MSRVRVSSAAPSQVVLKAALVGEGLIKAYFEHGPVDNLLAVEKEFELDLGEGLMLAGVIDFVIQGADGPEVVELKTSARSWSQLQAELSPQGSIYAMALGKGDREVPVTYRVLVETKTPKVQELRLVHPTEESGRISEVAHAVRRNLETGAFPRNEGVQTCSGCSYQGGAREGMSWRLEGRRGPVSLLLLAQTPVWYG